MSSQAARLKVEELQARARGLTSVVLRDVSPVLRWAGGKRQLIKVLLRYLPSDLAERKYHEPFLGAGSLFFRLAVPVAR